MELKDLSGHTSLPLESVRESLSREEVISVLPVRGDGPGEESVLVATLHKLVIVTGVRNGATCSTLLAPWAAVELHGEAGPTAAEPSAFRLGIRVSLRTFDAELRGPDAGTMLRDFVDALRARRRALGLGPSGRLAPRLRSGAAAPGSTPAWP